MLRTNLSSSITLITSRTLVEILTIPNIGLEVDATHDMSQYIKDPDGIRLDSDVLGLTTFASYDSDEEELTGLVEGVETGLQLKVTW